MSPPRRTSATVALAGAIASALAAGCASATLDVVRPVPATLDSVSLAIHDDTAGDMDDEDLRSLKRAITHELLDAGIEVLPATSRKDGVRVVGSVLRYDPGNRAVRFITHWGIGTGMLETEWDVLDRHSDSLARCDITGSVSMGTFGGSFDDVQHETGRALARCLKGELR